MSSRARGGWAVPASASRRGHRRRSRRYPALVGLTARYPGWRLVAGAVGFVLAVYLLALVPALLLARHELYAGLSSVDTAKSRLSTSGLTRDPSGALLGAESALRDADTTFSRADLLLLPYRPVLRPLASVPFLAQVGAAPAVAQMAHATADGALGLVTGMHPVLAGSRGPHHLSVPVLLSALHDQQPVFARACSSLDAAEATRLGIPAAASASLSSSLHTVDTRLPQLQVLCHTLTLLPAALGYGKPVSYLLAYQNPSQIRASGGFLGTVGLLTFRDGRATQSFHGTWVRDNLRYAPPVPMSMYEGEPAWLLRDSNWSPDFPTTAALERFFLRLDMGWRVQGVIDLTPQATADALRAIGSFYSPAYHRWITAGNVAALTDFYTHHSRNYGPIHSLSGDTARKQFIGIVAQHIVQHLNVLTPSVLVKLISDLSAAVPSRDVQLQFDNPALQSVVRGAGAAGEVNPTGSDFLYVVDSNLSYNKINPYVSTSVAYHALIRTDRWIEGDLTLRYTDRPAPADVYADSYGPGAGRTGTAADYADFIRVLVPAGAQLESQSGWQPSPPAAAYGKTMLSGYLIVRKGTTRTVHLRYLIPPNVFLPSAGNAYQLLVQHQAGTKPATLKLSVTTVAGPSAAHTYRQPTTDVNLNLAVPPLPFTTVPLPDAARPTVAVGHWIEPDAALTPR